MVLKASINVLLKPARTYWWKSWELRGRRLQREYPESRLQSCLDNTKMFFVLGTGRSGTQLLSSLLSKDENAVVLHEPCFNEDLYAMDSCRRDPEYALRYINDFRKYMICKIIEEHDTRVYGETTGMLRYHGSALKKVFPNADYLLITRDPRGFARSVMGWPQFYGKGSKGAYALAPVTGDPYYKKWEGMSRLEKIAWLWMDSYRILLQEMPQVPIIQLDKIVKDYEYFKGEILDRLPLEISYEGWRSVVEKGSDNVTKKYGFPHWSEWTEKDKESFSEICGEMMSRLGYDLEAW